MAKSFHLPYIPNPQPKDALTARMRGGGAPMLFQVLDPWLDEPLYPYMLALHVPPESLSENMSKVQTVVMTMGGYVEFNWPDELSDLNASGSTGGFLGPNTGLSVGSERANSDFTNLGRQGTIAWERQEDLLELFHNNGMVYNSAGEPVLRGRLMCLYDRGIYLGHFSSFDVEETDEKAWTFQLSWGFKVEKTLYRFPSLGVLNGQ